MLSDQEIEDILKSVPQETPLNERREVALNLLRKASGEKNRGALEKISPLETLEEERFEKALNWDILSFPVSLPVVITTDEVTTGEVSTAKALDVISDDKKLTEGNARPKTPSVFSTFGVFEWAIVCVVGLVVAIPLSRILIRVLTIFFRI